MTHDRHRSRAARRLAGRLGVLVAALLALLVAPAAAAFAQQPETVPGGDPGTRIEWLVLGVGAAVVLLAGGVALVLVNRPQRSHEAADDAGDGDEHEDEEALAGEEGEPAALDADAEPAPVDARADAPGAAEGDR